VHIILINLFLTNKGFPSPWVFTLSPAIWPSHNNCVVLHASQTAGLDQMCEPLSHFGGYHHLTEALHPLNLHHVLYCLVMSTNTAQPWKPTIKSISIASTLIYKCCLLLFLEKTQDQITNIEYVAKYISTAVHLDEDHCAVVAKSEVWRG